MSKGPSRKGSTGTKVTKAKPATKAKPKRPSKKKATAKSAPKQGLMRRLFKGAFSLGVKLALVVLAISVVVGIYLDNVVRSRFDGQLWDLPAVVYGRVLTLQPDQPITISNVKRELDLLQYEKVRTPKRPGQYSASSHKVELIRRPFEFEDGSEDSQHVMLTFSDSGLSKIEQLDRHSQMGYLRIEPKMLGLLEANNSEQRLFLPREQFPEFLVDALLVTEDRNFYQHEGVSPLAIARALITNIQAGRTVQGGSTLTQQLAKNLFLSRERTLWRKLREAYIALIIDYRYDKDRILEAYLNEIYLGQNGRQEVHGFALGARLYFGRPLGELRIDQQALLVAMAKGPSYYNPWRNPERAKERRDLVLRLMMKQGMLEGNEYEQAALRPLDIQDKPRIASKQPAYFAQLREELEQEVGNRFTPGQGLRIFSSLDPLSQYQAEQAVKSMAPKLSSKAKVEVETALIAADRLTGEIRAMVGGRRPGYAGFNRAMHASRQIGSLAKPAVYLTALEQPERYELASSLKDQPVKLKSDRGTTWEPRNYDRTYRGEVPLLVALAKSLNVPTVNLGMQVGLEQVITTFSRLGVPKSEIPPVPSILLGSFTLTPYQVTQMYQTLTSGGRRAELSVLRAVVDQDGMQLYQRYPTAQQVIPEQAAWLTTYGMKRVVSQGTGRYLQQQFGWAMLAGKTGTTDKNRDSWYVGVDGREVVTVWVGRDDNKPVNLTGSSGALRLYADYLHRREPLPLQLSWPKQLTTVKYHQQDGVLNYACEGEFSLPAWDPDGEQKARCSSGAGSWLKKVLSW